MPIARLLEQADRCHREMALEYYRAFAGHQDKLDIASIVRNYPELYSRETLDMVMGLDKTQLSDERERRFLRSVFTSNYMTGRLKEYLDRLANAESEAVVEVDNEHIPYRAAPVVLSNESDYTQRGEIDNAYIASLATMNPLREEADASYRELVSELGYRDTIDLVERLEQMRVYPMRELLMKFLDNTSEIYEERLTRYAAAAGLERKQLRHADIGFMHRAKRFDDLFPPQGMVHALSRTLQGLGIDLNNQSNVTLDLEERPKKSPRAFCIGINIPHDIRLVLQPRGGQDDYATLFHEAGHLEFGAHMNPNLSYLYRQHGDTSVHESYAFLFQHLVDDPVWWHKIMRADATEFTQFAKFHRLYLLRRYASKLQYEVEYYEQGGGPALAKNYATWLELGCGMPYPRARYLADFDSGFYVLQYLQAWIWEPQLRGYLRTEFGEAWFMSRSAGDFLKELWHDGQKYDVWEIAKRLGFVGLDIEPLLTELTS